MSKGEERVIAEGWITTSEAAKATGYATEYLRQLARAGKLKARKWMGAWLFREAEVLKYKRTMEQLGRRKHDPHGIDHALKGGER